MVNKSYNHKKILVIIPFILILLLSVLLEIKEPRKELVSFEITNENNTNEKFIVKASQEVEIIIKMKNQDHLNIRSLVINDKLYKVVRR